jgi:hypothetical protein
MDEKISEDEGKLKTVEHGTLDGKEIYLGQTERHTLNRKVAESHPQR